MDAEVTAKGRQRDWSDLCWHVVPGVAGCIIGDHQYDVAVWNAQALDGAIDGQDIAAVTIVQPVARRRDQHCPVARVIGRLE